MKYFVVLGAIISAVVLGMIVSFAPYALRITPAGNPAQLLVASPRHAPTLWAGQAAPSGSYRIFAVGDIMLGRLVETRIERRGPARLLGSMFPALRDADLVLANLEGPILEEHTKTPINAMRFSFDAGIASAILKINNIGMVSLANNHTYDLGRSGYEETRQHLAASGIGSFGNPITASTTHVASRETPFGAVTFAGFNATYPSFALEQATATIAGIRKADAKRIIAVAMHWGEEYQMTANAAQRDIAHALIDAGADVIFGHHPHVVQNIERYRGKMIFYSLGNFVFDQDFSKETQEGLAVLWNIDPDSDTYVLHPVDILESRPQLMPDDARGEWLEQLAARSDPALSEEISRGIIIGE